ncbi:trk system potassium uptake protein TrkH [Pseudozobellia thermophila]|uniref:Trk system potassium uptake protein TrkH n=1 Tax=Pseudozobellia thermophila TaxID=192903 RepID=A0A1M6HLL2_9FLAO|nr:trk system potassium uptake protein TrkH [Pseudozobellia thermophila]
MNLVWGFFLYTIIGLFLLTMPFLHKLEIELINNLFVATSAISTTGLVTIDIFDHYTFGGQLIIIALFQISGIGYMILTTYYILFTAHRITHWHHKVIGTEITLPKTIKNQRFHQYHHFHSCDCRFSRIYRDYRVMV